jgi:uncharacterized protein (UPF0303 family)
VSPRGPLDVLREQEERLQLARFDHDAAWRLGSRLVDVARAQRLAVTIDIRHGDQQVFHAALAGTSADNDAWVERKVRVVRRFGHSSLLMGRMLAAEETTLAERYRLDESVFAAHGGAFPVLVRGVGPVGVVTVSGLGEEEDHRLVITVLEAFLAGEG